MIICKRTTIPAFRRRRGRCAAPSRTHHRLLWVAPGMRLRVKHARLKSTLNSRPALYAIAHKAIFRWTQQAISGFEWRNQLEHRQPGTRESNRDALPSREQWGHAPEDVGTGWRWHAHPTRGQARRGEMQRLRVKWLSLLRLDRRGSTLDAARWNGRNNKARSDYMASGLVFVTRERAADLASESTPRPYLSFLMVISLQTDFTPLVLRAVAIAWLISSWLLAVPVIHTTPSLSVSTWICFMLPG